MPSGVMPTKIKADKIPGKGKIMNIKKFMAGLSAFVIALTAAATPLQEVIKAPQVLPQTAVNASAATYGDY